MLLQLDRGRQYDTVSLYEQLCRIFGQSYQSFDPFGLRRNGSNWKDLLTSQLNNFDRSVTTRGYTGHEQLDELGLIHMNGRVYDPKLGRFIQADTFIQFADNTQSYNRYSYVLNNPLRYTDPSGHYIPMVVGIVMAAAGASAGYTALAVGVAAFAQTLIMGGSFNDALKNGLIAGVSAFAFAQVGASDTFGYSPGQGTGQLAMNAVANGVVGGITSVLQGGKFGHGFASAGLSAFAKPSIRSTFGIEKNMMPARVVARAVIGGTISQVTGGKFANGAATAAFSQLFNEEFTLARARAEQAARKAGLGAVPGHDETGSNSWRASNDQVFTDAANAYNKKYGYSVGDSGYVKARMIKAWAMVESGGHKAEFFSDPLQVNNEGDWVTKKGSLLGLTEGGEMTPSTSVSAALGWFRHKGYIHDISGAETSFEGHWKALRDYNGNSKTTYRQTGGMEMRNWYADRVLTLYSGM